MRGLLRLLVGAGLMFVPIYTFSQNLSESSLSDNHEIEVCNSFSLGGFIRSVTYLGRTVDEDNLYLQSIYSEAALKLYATAGRIVTGQAEIRYKYGNEFQEGVSEIDLREIYLNLDLGKAGVRLGKQITAWGKGSFFNPTSKITPLDPTVRSPDPDDMKLGSWAIQGRINMGQFMKLTAIWEPIYMPSVLLIDPVPMPEYVLFEPENFPGVELKHSSYGLKYDLYTSQLDGSVYWFEGYHHWPGITFTMEPESLLLSEKAYRIRMLGTDLSIPFGSWIFRAEGAWQEPVESFKDHDFVPFPEISFTAEVERSGTIFSMLVGYYGKYILDYSSHVAAASLSADPEEFGQLTQQGVGLTDEMIDGMIRARVDAFNRLYNYQLEEIYHTGFVVGKLNMFHNQLEFTLPVIYNFTTEEMVIQPGLSFTPVDGLKISAGFSGLYGPGSSLYDLVGPALNAGFLSLKVTF